MKQDNFARQQQPHHSTSSYSLSARWLYICATRYADYMHAGWDILSGSLIGMGFAYIGFRWYHIW